jgi:hypothetical protein
VDEIKARGVIMRVAVGQSDAEDAIEAVLAAVAHDGPQSPHAAILYASIDYDHEVLVAHVRAKYPGIRLVGGSATGTAERAAYLSDGVALTVFEDGNATFAVGAGEALSQDVPAACVTAVGQLMTQLSETPKIVVVLADGLAGDMDVVAQSLKGAFGADPPRIFGGCSADDFRFEKTQQYADDAVLTHSVVLLAIGGDVTVGVGVGTGWKPVGSPMKVTRSAGSTVQEIDGVPAYDVYRERLGEIESQQLIEFPLAIMPSADDDELYSLRTVHTRLDDGALAAFGTVPEGACVRMTVASDGDILDGARDSNRDALAQNPAPEAVMLVSCGARQTLLGTRVAEERLSIGDQLAASGLPDVPYLVLYGYGETGTDATARTGFCDETCISVALSGG